MPLNSQSDVWGFFFFFHVNWYFVYNLNIVGDFQVVLVVKNLPAIQETRVQSLGQQDPLDKGMVTHSSILTWKIPWTEEPGRLQSIGSRRVGHNWATNTVTCDWFWPIGSGGRWDPSLSAGAIWNYGNHVLRCFTRWRDSGSTESNMESSGGLPDPITLSMSEKLNFVGWSHWNMGV